MDTSVRTTAVYDFSDDSNVLRGQNFFVEWLKGTDTRFEASSNHEMLLMLPRGAAEVHTTEGIARYSARQAIVLAPGSVTIKLTSEHPAILIASSRIDVENCTVGNDADYENLDVRLRPSDAGYRRIKGRGLSHVIDIDSITPPADKPRLKMLQTETLSINWVEYEGARDRSKLSPHSHPDFEQGSLAVEGHYVHHVRVPWGADANQWRGDEHLEAGPASLISIPAHMVHTTEGVGDGPHLLIDVFSPPREDFISKDWVSNSADYTRG